MSLTKLVHNLLSIVNLDQISHPYLVCIVYDVLVVHQRIAAHHVLLPHCPGVLLLLLRRLLCGTVRVFYRQTRRNGKAARSHYKLVAQIRAIPSAALYAQEGSLKILDVLCLVQLLHLAQRYFAQNQDFRGDSVGVCVTLAEHVSEVDTFAKHVACRRSLWGRDSQSLREDPEIIGHRRPVEQEHARMLVFEWRKFLRFSFSFNPENSNVFKI